MPTLSWYWHRLRAMSPSETVLHLRKRFRQRADIQGPPKPSYDLAASGLFPRLPKPDSAPAELRDALRQESADILAGRWKAFGHLNLQVDDPPKWHCDYLARQNLATTESAFALEHRELPAGTDIKLIWELSRWYQLTRLAMAAYVLGDERSADKCLQWLEDWVQQNPPYSGWNWTSPLEAGLRLIQFTWIDALLIDASWARAQNETAPDGGLTHQARLERLRRTLLPAHVWYVWRYHSFGSSANNHLLGELTGLIVSTVRWPELVSWGAPLLQLQKLLDTAILAQFASDGGNREQALNYHLFSWELCQQATRALRQAKLSVSIEVERRLRAAGQFFWEMQARKDAWDYGDSDSAFAVPLFLDPSAAIREWHSWIEKPRASAGIGYWLGEPEIPILGVKFTPPPIALEQSGWWFFPISGMAIHESGFWWLRWDLSPLGYLSTAAHGHLDALHLSIWFKHVALIIDPGTGAYRSDKPLRDWLASRAAHNGPCPFGEEYPRRTGPFLWNGRHAVPKLVTDRYGAAGTLDLPHSRQRRCIRPSADGLSWTVEDSVTSKNGRPQPFTVRWQFAPGTWIKRHALSRFTIHRGDVAMTMELADEWATVELVESDDDVVYLPAGAGGAGNDRTLQGTVSPAFRQTVWAPYLKLEARPTGDKPCVFRTTFLASPIA